MPCEAGYYGKVESSSGWGAVVRLPDLRSSTLPVASGDIVAVRGMPGERRRVIPGRRALAEA
jgi:hypothetical protein